MSTANIITIPAIAPDLHRPLCTTTIAKPLLAPIAPLTDLPHWATILASKTGLQDHALSLATIKAIHVAGTLLTTVVACAKPDTVNKMNMETTPCHCCCLHHDAHFEN
jgi:hypothetical protein